MVRLRAIGAHWATYPIVLFVFSRAAVLAASSISMRLVPHMGFVGDLPRMQVVFQHPSLDGLFRWDTGWYETIARAGNYRGEQANFWPLYPMLSRALSEITPLHLHYCMLLVANLASLGSFIVMYRLFEKLSDQQSARWGVALYAAYPFAFFQAAAYPESMTVFFTALSVLLAVSSSHLGAGAALALGVLTRHTAIWTGLALAWVQLRERGWRTLISPKLIGLFLPLLSVAGFAWFLKGRYGDPLMFLTVREIFWADGFQSVWTVLVQEFAAPAPSPEFVPPIFLSSIVAAGCLALWFKAEWRPLAPVAMLWLGVVYLFGATGVGRHSSSCWPAFLPLGVLLARVPLLQAPSVIFLACLQSIFIFAFSHHFHVF